MDTDFIKNLDDDSLIELLSTLEALDKELEEEAGEKDE